MRGKENIRTICDCHALPRHPFCPDFSTEILCNEKSRFRSRLVTFAGRLPVFSPFQPLLLSPRLPTNMPSNALNGGGVLCGRAARSLSTAVPCYDIGTAVRIARLSSENLEDTGKSDISAHGADTQNVNQMCAKLAHLRAREAVVANFARMRAFTEDFCQEK